MIDTEARDQHDVLADITRSLTASITDGVPEDPARLGALWHEMGRLAGADRGLPGWTSVAAHLLGDRYEADARLSG